MSNDEINENALTAGQKKRNTILFIVIGTIVNVILCLTLIVILTLIASKTLPENILSYAIPIIFILAVVLGMIIYQKIANWVIAKWNLNNKMSPLFVKKHSKKRY